MSAGKKATDREIIDALETMSQYQAARHFGMNTRTMQRRVARIKEAEGYASPAPGYSVKGVSALVKPDGTEVMRWVKTDKDIEEKAAKLKEVADALIEKLPREKPVAAPKHGNDLLLNLYTITDYHIGMYSWEEETGENWDSTIAEDLLVRWFAQAIKQSPKANQCVFAQVGDFLHYDSLLSVTPQNKNLLDSDTRFQMMIRIAIRVVRRIIQMLLAKYEQVHVVMATGNHDEASSAWLREMLAAMYADEPRISIETSADVYYCREFGNTALFFHHGHKRKLKDIDHVFAAKFREVYGRTKYNYAHIGHLHSTQVHESNLMTVEQHPTLAAKDAYASHGGWMSQRAAKVTTYHKEHGKVGELIITPEMTND